MSEFSHDSVDDGFHEIQLSGKQLVFLFMATTVVSVVIFLCGVLVGRGVHIVQPAEAAQAPTAAHEAVPPPSSVPGSVPPPASDPQPVAQAAPPAAAQTTAPPAPPAGDELTYRKRLEGEGTPTEEKLKPSDASKTADAPKSTSKAATPKASSPPDTAPTTGVARPGTWVVQLAALRDRAAAGSIVQRLTGRGYPAYIVNPSSGAPTPVYRVQVGRYEDRHEAEQVARRLEKEEKFNTWISR